jgi:hypothetical protein
VPQQPTVAELAGEDPARVFPGTAIHLQSCPGCQADHAGLLEAASATTSTERHPLSLVGVGQ